VELRSVGDVETFEGISIRDESTRSKDHGKEKHGLPKECEVLARVTGVSTCCFVSATLFEILDREIRCVGDGP
jgi:hypothetical protein